MMTLERDLCSKIILAGIILVGILSHSRYQCERYTQWEKWAEVTPGHSITVKENNLKTAMVWSDNLFTMGVMYI